MDLTVRRETTGIEVWMPVKEAVAFLQNPARAQAEVRTCLRAGGVDPETGKAIQASQKSGRVAVRMAERRGANDDFNQYDQGPAGSPARGKMACDWPGCDKVCRGSAALVLHRRMHEREAAKR